MTTSPHLKETWRTVCHPSQENSQQSAVLYLKELHLTPAPPTIRGDSTQRECAPSYTLLSFRYFTLTGINNLIFTGGVHLFTHVRPSLIVQVCHDVVEREPYYRLCLSEVCGCHPQRSCHCNILTAYSRHCAQEGAEVHWRNQTFCRKF